MKRRLLRLSLLIALWSIFVTVFWFTLPPGPRVVVDSRMGSVPVGFSDDGKRLVTWRKSRNLPKYEINVWDAHNGNSLQRMEGVADKMYRPTLSPDGNNVVVQDYSTRTVYIWDTVTGK